jgi:CHAT domain-containing protein
MSKIMSKLELSASRVVVLSACETGITEVRDSPDEYIGLPAGFLQAGTAAVISSLWSVNDLSTRLLMEQFYKQLFGQHGNQALPPASALREAQLWLKSLSADEIRKVVGEDILVEEFPRMAGEISHPHHWAAFTISGV